MPRLRTVSRTTPGGHRVRHGRGHRYLDVDGSPLGEQQVERAKALAIPRPGGTCGSHRPHPISRPSAWDGGGRKQYLYHPHWRQKREMRKFERRVGLAGRSPRVRRRWARPEGRRLECRCFDAVVVHLVPSSAWVTTSSTTKQRLLRVDHREPRHIPARTPSAFCSGQRGHWDETVSRRGLARVVAKHGLCPRRQMLVQYGARPSVGPLTPGHQRLPPRAPPHAASRPRTSALGRAGGRHLGSGRSGRAARPAPPRCRRVKDAAECSATPRRCAGPPTSTPGSS